MTNKIANAFGSTFAFLQTQKAQLKMQKSYQANAPSQRQFTDITRQKNKGERITNAIANAGMRVR